MSLNRRELSTKLGTVTSELLKEKGYICFVDVFQKLGYLPKQDYEAWRKGQLPYLEKAIQVNLARISFIMKTVIKNSRSGKLKENITPYSAWGNSRKRLRFSKSSDPRIERAYSTHFLKPGCFEHKNDE